MQTDADKVFSKTQYAFTNKILKKGETEKLYQHNKEYI
jgi:hypothetical protein